MKKQQIKWFFIALSVFYSGSVLSAEGKEYIGCGSTNDEARFQLGKNISSSLSSSTTEKTVVKNDGSWLDIITGGSLFSEASSQSSSKSNMKLCDVKITSENGEQCAKVTHKALVKCAKNNLSTQLKYTLNNLPKVKDQKLKVARGWVEDISSTDELYKVVQSNLPPDNLARLTEIKNKLLKLLDNQYVRFEVIGENLKIVLNDNKTILPFRDTSVKVAEHKYRITGPDYCSVEAKFSVTDKAKKVIKVDMTKNTFPELTFTTNQANATIFVDGKRIKAGKRMVLKSCSGTIPYAFNFESQTIDGKVSLKPGLQTEIRETFLSKADIAKNRDLANAYSKGTLWQVQYINLLTNERTNNIDSLSGIRLSQIKLSNAIRWGYNLVYAQGDEDSYAAEMNAQVGLQLLNFGKNNMPLYIGPLVLIPHIDIDIGLGYHNLNEVDTFENTGDTGFSKFYRSFVVLRPGIGFDIPFSREFSLSLNYSRSAFMNESDVFSFGLNVRTN